jgi:hypothetical protein
LTADTLIVVEMNFGLCIRVAPDPSEPRFITVSGGASFLRTDVTIPPDNDRVYLGPYVGLGVDQYISNQYILSLQGRYGMLAGGPTALTILLSFQFGK